MTMHLKEVIILLQQVEQLLLVAIIKFTLLLVPVHFQFVRYQRPLLVMQENM